MPPDLNAELKFLVIGLAPKNKIWAAFDREGDAHQYTKNVPYGRVIRADEYENGESLRSSSR
jgi:hypothetical protein